jgi:hypothetical protein
MSEDYEKDPLWEILVETVHALVMYPRHKAYIREVLLREKPDMEAKEASRFLGIPLGEALVIFSELKKEGHIRSEAKILG